MGLKNKLIILLIMTIFLAGCSPINPVDHVTPIYNLSDFILSDFIDIINELDTPEKICQYMETNFVYELHLLDSYDPYEMWLVNRAGDCNDYSTFAVFVADYHGYETYQILIHYYDKMSHMLGVFVEGEFTYSDVWIYHPIQVDTFEEIVKHHCDLSNRELKSYIVYDYNMKIVKE